MLEVARLATHSDCCVEIEGQLIAFAINGRALGLAFNKAIEASDVLELGVRVQEECRVVRVREPKRVQLL